MPFTKEVIEGAAARYERERDRYIKLAGRVADARVRQSRAGDCGASSAMP
jgi:hypothetical protein